MVLKREGTGPFCTRVRLSIRSVFQAQEPQNKRLCHACRLSEIPYPFMGRRYAVEISRAVKRRLISNQGSRESSQRRW